MKARAVLNLSHTSYANVVINATHIVNNMTGNPLFAAADIVAQVTATKAAITALQAVLSAPGSDTKTDTIKAARETLDRTLTILATKVEAVANHPALQDDQRTGVMHSAGLEIKTPSPAKKRVFAVVHGGLEGSVHLTATGGAKAHEWQYTSDLETFNNRTILTSTTKASTEVHGLKVGIKYAFFHKPIIAKASTDWEGPKFITAI